MPIDDDNDPSAAAAVDEIDYSLFDIKKEPLPSDDEDDDDKTSSLPGIEPPPAHDNKPSDDDTFTHM